MRNEGEYLHSLNRQLKENPPEPEKREELMNALKNFAREAQSAQEYSKALWWVWMARRHPKVVRLSAQIRLKRRLPAWRLQQLLDFFVNSADRHLAEGAALGDPIMQRCVVLRTLWTRYGKPAMVLLAFAVVASLAAEIGTEAGLHGNPLWHFVLTVLNGFSLLLATTALGMILAVIALAILSSFRQPGYLARSV